MKSVTGHEEGQQRPRLLDTKRTTQEYGLSGPWLRKMRWLRKGPAYVRAGKKVLYPRESLEQFISDNTVRAQGDQQAQDDETKRQG